MGGWGVREMQSVDEREGTAFSERHPLLSWAGNSTCDCCAHFTGHLFAVGGQNTVAPGR